MGPNYKEDKDLILYPNKNGRISDVLEEAVKVVELSPAGTGQLRIVEVSCHKLMPGPDLNQSLENLSSNSPKVYRIEEIPRDELHLQVWLLVF